MELINNIDKIESHFKNAVITIGNFDGVHLGHQEILAAARQTAVARWRAMRGRTGTLHTGHHLIDLGTDRFIEAVASADVTFAEVTDAEVEAYVATGEPLAVAGGFTIDGLGGPFVAAVDGDPHTVVGVSLPLLRRLLAELGYPWPALWPPEMTT